MGFSTERKCYMESNDTAAKSYTEPQAAETHLRVIRLAVMESITRSVSP